MAKTGRPRAKHEGENTRRGVFSVLLQFIASHRPRRRVTVRLRDAAPAPTTAAPQSPIQRQSHGLTTSGLTAAVSRLSPATESGVATPAPPRDPDADEESEDESDSEAGGDADDHEEQGDGADASPDKRPRDKKKKTTTKKTRGYSKWVPKLLNQAAPHKDRVHSRKKRRPHASAEAPVACHEMLRVVKDPFTALLARVFDFLEPLQPSRRCALVNRALAVAVRQYYARSCAWPRPTPYLAHHILSWEHAETAGFLRRVLGMLPSADRVRAGATSRAFRREADALPLEFTRPTRAARFLRVVSADRVEQRYRKTAALCFEATPARDAIQLLQLMSDAEGDHFIGVHDIHLRRLPGGFRCEGDFVLLVQALFSDRVSRPLRSLALADLRLEDVHFRHLARLFYDGHFPCLQTLDLSGNLFSSRFMRDWARCFREDRFASLSSLDITGVGMGVEDMERFFGCLRHTQKLRSLRVSHNFCSQQSLEVFARVVTERRLAELEELGCSAISASDYAIHILLEALRTPGACDALRRLDLSGNVMGGSEFSMRSLGEALSCGCWPRLQVLNLSYTKPTELGSHLLARGLEKKHHRAALHEIHLAGNGLGGDAFECLVMMMETGAIANVQLLNLADNQLGALEFELLANCLSRNACPRLQSLLLSMNCAKADGVVRFRRVFGSAVAPTLHTLDLSANAIPPHSLTFLADELLKSSCLQLQVLNVSRNVELRSVLRFQQLIRGGKCPSLACLQVGYAQSETQGYEFVRKVRATMSVEELRRLKQLKFEARMKRIEQDNVEKAARAAARCKRQTTLLREMYDHMESQADRALRRRKRVRKSPHLHIHEEIQRLKQDKYHESVRLNLERAMLASV